MAKLNLIKSNFTSGELSKKIWLRTDLKQYQDGLKEAFNVLPIIEGGIRKRSGTKVLSQQPHAIKLIPFTLNHKQTFILAFRPSMIDILSNDGQIIRAVVTNYTAQQINELTYYQNRHQLYIAHPDHPLSWLRVSEDLSNWDFGIFEFSVPPLEEADTPEVAVKPTETAVGKVVSLIASPYEQYLNNKRYMTNDICWHDIQDSRYYFKAKQYTQGNTPTLGTTHESVPVPDPYWEVTTIVASNVFTEEDVGKYIFINSGIIEIQACIHGAELVGKILVKLNSDVEAIPNSWVFKQNIFTDDYGYPKAVSVFQQRLVLGGTKKYPNYVYFSRVGDVTNFLPTTDDGDSFTVSASSDELTNVLHIAQSKGIVIFTGGSEQTITTSNSLSPTNANIYESTTYGITENIKPIKIGSELLFVQKSGERLRTLLYDYSVDSLVSNELTVLASHIAKENGGFKQLVYQAEPDSIVWCVMGNGSLASLTINREQSVTSWARHDIGGTVLSVLTLPSQSGADRLYFLVDRDGTIQIEEMVEGLLLDSALEVNVQVTGKEVKVQDVEISRLGSHAAVYYKDEHTVYSIPIKQRTLDTLILECDPTVQKVYIGRKFTSRISLFPPEVQQTPTTSSPALFKINYINLYLFESMNPKLNGDLLELRQFEDDFFQPQPLYTGVKRVEMNGWNTFDNFKLVIEQDEPLPFHLTAVVLESNFNER